MEHEERMLNAASMYYLQDLKMEVIAKHLRTSRSTVSRLIKEAREVGLVKISLHPDQTRAPGLSETIQRLFAVRGYVVPVPDSGDPGERRRQVAVATAKLLSDWFASDMVMGVAWGSTTAEIAQRLPQKATRGASVVQLNGAANGRASGLLYAEQLLATVGKAFGAAVHYFPVPAFFDYPETRELMWRERSVKEVLELQRRTDIAVFGIGAVGGALPSHVYSAGYLDRADLKLLHKERVVGDVCTVFLRSDGSYEDIALNARATGPTPAELQRIPRRVCTVSGDHKVEPLLGALRARAITDLVIDEQTASQLVQAAGVRPDVTLPRVARTVRR